MRLFGEDNFSLRITFTNECNAKCKTCLTPLIRRPKEYMSFTVFKQIIDSIQQLDNLGGIEFYSIGENYLHPDFVDMVEWAIPKFKHKNIGTTIVTNGIAVTRVPKGIDDFYISFNAGKPATYNEITGLSFDKTVRNIYRLYEEGEFKKANNVQIHMLVFNENKNEIKDIKKTFRKLRGVKLRLSYKYDNQHGSIDNEGIKYSVFKRIPCNYVTRMLTFYSNGDLIICPHDFEGEIKFGNIIDTDIYELLNNSHRIKLLEQHLNGTFESLCAACNYNIESEGLFEFYNLHIIDRYISRFKLLHKVIYHILK